MANRCQCECEGEGSRDLLKSTINELTRDHPATLQVLHHHGLDCCCGGHRPVAEAAERHGVDVNALVQDLERATRG